MVKGRNETKQINERGGRIEKHNFPMIESTEDCFKYSFRRASARSSAGMYMKCS